MGLPSDPEGYQDDQVWRVVYGFPMVLITIQLIVFLTVFKWEPIDFSIAAGKDENALKMIELLYEPKDTTLSKEFVYR
jgi:hypothetical protein